MNLRSMDMFLKIIIIRIMMMMMMMIIFYIYFFFNLLEIMKWMFNYLLLVINGWLIYSIYIASLEYNR